MKTAQIIECPDGTYTVVCVGPSRVSYTSMLTHAQAFAKIVEWMRTARS